MINNWLIIIYQTSCKKKLVVPYTCVYISKDMFDLHNFERSAKS